MPPQPHAGHPAPSPPTRSASSATGRRPPISEAGQPSATPSPAPSLPPRMPGRGDVVLTVTQRPRRPRRGGDQRRLRLAATRMRRCRQATHGAAFYTAGRSAFARDGQRRRGAFARGRQAVAKLARPRKAHGDRHVQPARLRARLRRHQQGVRGQTLIRRAALTEAERTRILAKSALFNPPPHVLPDGRRDLVGLTREELAAEMAAIGEKPFRAKQLWHWIYHQGATDFAAMSRIARPLQEKLAERFVIGRPVVATEQTSTRRDAQVAVPLPRRAGGGDRLHPRPHAGPRRRLHQQPGRLHPVLPVLPHRHADAGAQPGRGRDRGPVHGRARRLRRVAEPAGRDAAAAEHHRADGHGRAAVQLRERRQRDAHRHGRRGHRPVAPPHHAVAPPAWCR